MKYPTMRVVFDRKHIATNKKTGLVQIEILHNKKRKWIGTGVKVYAGQWKDKCMVCMRSDAIDLNEQINIQVTNIREMINKMFKEKEDFSLEKLEAILNRSNNPESFINFVETRIEERKIKFATKKQHYVMLRALKDFGLIQYFSDVSLKNIKLFDDYIKKKVKQQSSVYGYHKRLKVYVNEAFQLDLIKKNPYIGFSIPRGENQTRKYLEPEELEKVKKVELTDESLSKVRDCFVFCCYTGLAYADLAKFNFQRDVIRKADKYYIEDVRQKTGSRYKILILSPAMEILNKYNKQLPIITNQKYNEKLKLIGLYAGINKALTSHVARHTFATWTLSQGIRIETVSKMLAHQDIRTTQIYAKILQTEVDEAFDKLEKRLTI